MFMDSAPATRHQRLRPDCFFTFTITSYPDASVLVVQHESAIYLARHVNDPPNRLEVVDTLDLIARTVKRKQDCFGSIELSGKFGGHELNGGGILCRGLIRR